MIIFLLGSFSIQIPCIVDGVIPANEHGNIEVWDGNARFVPEGARFIDHPQAERVAKSIGVRYVPALIGFERKGQKFVPKMGGIVVLETDVSIMHDALFEVTAWKTEVAYNKREGEIMLKWSGLARRILMRHRLKDEYGH